MEGLWPGVAAFANDADMVCVHCAKEIYGASIIEEVIDGTPGHEQYTDREGNPFNVVLNGSEDLLDLDTVPPSSQRCGSCGEPLIEDWDEQEEEPDEEEDDENESEDDL